MTVYTPKYSTDACRSTAEFTVGNFRLQQTGGRMPRRALRKELEAKGMTREQAEQYLSAHGFPRPQQAKRKGAK